TDTPVGEAMNGGLRGEPDVLLLADVERPQLLSGRGVKRIYVPIGRRHVRGAADDDRIVLGAGRLDAETPGDLQRLDVRRVDLGQRAVPLAVERAVDVRPV